MSHSSGGVNGFGSGKSGAQVTDRLKLLKQKQSTSSSQSGDKGKREFIGASYENEEESIPQFGCSDVNIGLAAGGVPSDRNKANNAVGGLNQRKFNIQGGPVKATHDDAHSSSINNMTEESYPS